MAKGWSKFVSKNSEVTVRLSAKDVRQALRRTSSSAVTNIKRNRGHAHAIVHAASDDGLPRYVLYSNVHKSRIGKLEGVVNDLGEGSVPGQQAASYLSAPSQRTIVPPHQPTTPLARNDLQNSLDIIGIAAGHPAQFRVGRHDFVGDFFQHGA